MVFIMNNDEWIIKEISNSEMNMICSSDLKETFVHGITQYNESTIYINEDSPNKERTLYHELMHCYMYEYGINQWDKNFSNEDICELSASSYKIIFQIIKKYICERVGEKNV